jgi:hypothetical protein
MWKNVGRRPTFVMIGESETKKERSSQRWVLKGQQPEIFLLFELFDF